MNYFLLIIVFEETAVYFWMLKLLRNIQKKQCLKEKKAVHIHLGTTGSLSSSVFRISVFSSFLPEHQGFVCLFCFVLFTFWNGRQYSAFCKADRVRIYQITVAFRASSHSPKRNKWRWADVIIFKMAMLSIDKITL